MGRCGRHDLHDATLGRPVTGSQQVGEPVHDVGAVEARAADLPQPVPPAHGQQAVGPGRARREETGRLGRAGDTVAAPGGQRAEPCHGAPGVMRAAEHRHAREHLENAAEAGAGGTDSAMRRAKRRKHAPIDPGQRRERAPAAGERRRQAFLADGIRYRVAGELQDEPVLRVEHRARRSPGFGLGLAQPEQPRQGVESIEMLRFRMVGHPRPLQRPLGRTACPGVAKPDCGAHGTPSDVDEDLTARRAAGHHRCQRIESHWPPPTPPRRRRRCATIGRGAARSGRSRPRRIPPGRRSTPPPSLPG